MDVSNASLKGSAVSARGTLTFVKIGWRLFMDIEAGCGRGFGDGVGVWDRR